MTSIKNLSDLSETISKLLTSNSSSNKSLLSAATNYFVSQYKRGILKPTNLSSLELAADAPTRAVEKRLEVFLDCLKGHEEVEGLEIAKARIAALGRVSIENLNEVLSEKVANTLIQMKAENDPNSPLAFGAIDALAILTSNLSVIASQKGLKANQIDSIFAILERINRDCFKWNKFALLPQEQLEDNALGKRNSSSSHSKVTAEHLGNIVKLNIDSIVSNLMKNLKADATDDATVKTLGCLTPHVLSLMQNPLLIAHYAVSNLNKPSEEVQDQALVLLLTLISRHSLDQPDYYNLLYSICQRRQTYSLQFLKVLEVSLRSNKLASSLAIPFIKFLLHRCLEADIRTNCWILGLTINLLKNNDGIVSMFISNGPDSDPEESFRLWNTELSLEEASKISSKIKGWELLTLRKHISKEVRTLAEMIGNPLDRVDYVELDDLAGLDEVKAFKLALLRLKTAKFAPNLEEEEKAPHNDF